jgi:3-hydroxyisobutyrate dehydrogenase-like beta-hydroxyacid dehydrogenase
MAARLIAAGHHVRAWNRSHQAVDDLAAKGALAVATPAEAADAEILCCMLADDAAIRTAILDAGVLESVKRGLVFANCSTISVAFVRELARRCAERGVGYIAAPVLGRPDAAADGKLHMLVAGSSADVERARPVLEVMAQKLWALGEEPECANAVKLAANFMIAATIEQIGEAMELAGAYGVEPTKFLAVITGTIFGSPAVANYGRAIAEQRFQPAGFALKLGAKDVRLTLAAAEEASLPMPVASLLRDRFIAAIARGDGELDWSAITKRR